MRFLQRLVENKEFHLELSEKLMGKNYMKKFLNPTKSYLTILGRGQLISENDLISNKNANDGGKLSTVTVT